jgi:hypothetical protein
MRTFLIGLVVAVAAALLGVGAAYGAGSLAKDYRTRNAELVDTVPDSGWCMNGGSPADGRRFDGMRDRMRDRLEQFQDLKSDGGNWAP